VKAAVLELRCDFELVEKGKLRPLVRTEADEDELPSHRLQLAITLPDTAPGSVQFKARPRS